MDLDPQTGGIAAIIATAIGLAVKFGGRKALRWFFGELAIFLAAAFEQARIREAKRRRNGDASPPDGTPTFVEPDEETTDMHGLVELEKSRARRKTQQRKTERTPRPGTHSDRLGGKE